MATIYELTYSGDVLFHVILVFVDLPRVLTWLAHSAKRALAAATASSSLLTTTITMASHSSSSLLRNIQTLKQSLPHYLSKTDAHISHVNR